jgi:hypothetical protein
VAVEVGVDKWLMTEEAKRVVGRCIGALRNPVGIIDFIVHGISLTVAGALPSPREIDPRISCES